MRGIWRLALLLTTCLTGSDVLALGPAAHKAIGVLAWDRLSAETRAHLDALLPGGREVFGEGCNWPDQAKLTPEYAHTIPLHFVNIPRGESYSAERDCREGHCIIDALPRFAAVIGDVQADVARRAEALKFVCHFMGDLHQPLHVGHLEDRGGSILTLHLDERESLLLHTVWDHVLPAFLVSDDWMDPRLPTACAPPEEAWSRELVLAWMAESRGYVDRPGLIYPEDDRLTAEFIGQGVTFSRRQMCLASVRLANLLESVLR